MLFIFFNCLNYFKLLLFLNKKINLGNKKLSLFYRGLPLNLKQKNFKEWVMPVKLNTAIFYRLENETIGIATFNRIQDLNRALKQNDQFFGGYKVL